MKGQTKRRPDGSAVQAGGTYDRKSGSGCNTKSPSRKTKRAKAARAMYGYDWEQTQRYPPAFFGKREKALYRTIFAWVQQEAAKRGEKETYYVLQTRSIAAVVAAEHAEALQTVGDLDRCYGIGESKLRRYGQDLYQVIKEERLKY